MTGNISEPTGSTQGAGPSATDTLHLAYAEASIMLLESVLTTLMRRNVLSRTDVEEAFEVAIETKTVFATENIHREISIIAAGVLKRMGNSVASLPTSLPADRT